MVQSLCNGSQIKEEFSLLRSTLEDADIKVEKQKKKNMDEGKGPIVDGEPEELLSCILVN